MIFVTGDTHGEIDFAKLNDLKKKKVTRDDILIICGDVGVCWSEHDFPRMVQMYESIGCTVFFVDGNHENFTMLEFNFPLVHRYGAKIHQPRTVRWSSAFQYRHRRQPCTCCAW